MVAIKSLREIILMLILLIFIIIIVSSIVFYLMKPSNDGKSFMEKAIENVTKIVKDFFTIKK